MLESSLVTYRNEIIDYNIGTPTSVEFNFERIWSFKRSLKDKFYPIHLKFYHVHPSGFLFLSNLDFKCMEGLRIALGEPIVFGIITFGSPDPLDVHNIKYNSYSHYLDLDSKSYVEDLGENHRLSHSQLILLKRLSYGTAKL